MSEVRNRGKIFAITIYIFTSIMYVVFAIINNAVDTWNVLGTSFFCILGAILLFVVMPDKNRSFMFDVIWSALLIVLAGISGFVFGDSKISLGIFMLQWIVSVNFLRERYLKLLCGMQFVSVVATNLGMYFLRPDIFMGVKSVIIDGLIIAIAYWISEGMVKNLILVYEEIDEQRLSLNEFLKLLKEKNEQAQAATKSKSAFLSNMSHEIRTPINSILGMNELILRESQEPEVLEKAGIIKSSSELLLSLVNDILDFSKIESGKMELVVSEYHLLSLVNDIYNIFSMRMADKQLELIMDVDPKLPAVLMGDSVRLRQVIINLMTNALKYTDEGTVTFRMYSSPSEKAGCVMLNVEVVDTGIGIAEEDLGKLNESFVRLSLSRNHTVEGTGLGINIVNGFLKMMGSNLAVESLVGVGSRFYFSVDQEVVQDVPIGQYEPNTRMGIQTQKDQVGTRVIAPEAKLLVVDDNSANIKVFVGLLQHLKMDIDTAFSGESAIKLCNEKAYDLIFMDHMMPGMDGKEAFHHIHEESKLNQSTPVFILTANAIAGAKEEYLREGFWGYLTKPIIPDKLEGAILDTLDPSMLVEVQDEEIAPQTEEKSANWDTSEFPPIEGVDWEYAKLHFAQKELLLEIIKSFSFGLSGGIKQVSEYYERLQANREDECINDFRILVHSNKSSANMCGIIPLAGLSATLEYAARDGRVDTILDMTPHYIAECEKYKAYLDEAFGFAMQNGDKAIDPEEIRQILSELMEAADAFDVKGMDACMERLTDFCFEGELKEAEMHLGQLVANLETDRMAKVVEQIIAGVS